MHLISCQSVALRRIKAKWSAITLSVASAEEVMKVLFALIGLCAVGCALGAFNFHRTPSRSRDIDYNSRSEKYYFEEGREFNFWYDAQYDSGMSGSSDEHSFTRIRAKVYAVFKSPSVLFWQLSDIQFGKSNQKVTGMEILDMGKFERVQPDQELLAALQLPVKNTWDAGMFSEVIFDERDTTWSKNFKRGVFTLSQIDMKLIDRMGDYYKDDLDEDEPRSMEVLPEGECGVFYSKKIDNNDKKTFNVTKTIDFHNCNQRADIRYNYRFSSSCSSCAQTEPGHKNISEQVDSVARQTIVNFVVEGNANRYLLHQVDVVSQYVTPFLVTKQETEMTTLVLGRLTLISASEDSNRLRHVSQEGITESVMYSLDWDLDEEKFYMYGDSAFEGRRNTPFVGVTRKVEQVVNLLKKIVEDSKIVESGVTQEQNTMFVRSVGLVRMMTMAELEEVEQKIAEYRYNEEQKEVMELFLNIVSSSNTMNTYAFYVNKVLDGTVGPLEATFALKKFVNVMQPSDKQIDKVLQLCKSDLAKQKHNVFLRQSCYLSVSTMINALCKVNNDVTATFIGKTKCDITLKRKYLQELKDIITHRENVMEQMIFIKAIQNAGLDIAVHELEQIIQDRQHQTKYSRAAAIEGLRHLAGVMPRKVVRVLLPIFENNREHTLVRMSAFHILMHTYPKRDILASMVYTMAREGKTPFTAFVLDSLRSFKMSKNPCLKKISDELSNLLTLANFEVTYENNFGGKLDGIDLYNDETQSGFFLYHYALSNTDVLFKKTLIGLDAIFNGRWHNDIFQLGVVDANLQIEKWIQKVGDFINKKILPAAEETRTRGHRSSQSPREMLKNLMRILKIEGRDEKDKSLSVLLGRFKDFEQLILPLDYHVYESLITPYLKNSRFGKNKFTWNTASYLYETMNKIPTSLGLPLVVSTKLPMVVFARGNLDLSLGNNFRTKLDSHLTMAQTHIATSEVWTPAFSTGFESIKTLETNLPIHVKIDYSSQHKEIHLTYEVPEKTQNLVTFRTSPAVYIQTNTAYETKMEKMTVVNRYFKHTFHTTRQSYGEQLTGLPVAIHQTGYDLFALNNPVQVLLSGENYYQVTMEPKRYSPKTVKFTMKFDQEKLRRMEAPSDFEKFYETEPEKRYFAVSGRPEHETQSRIEAFRNKIRSWRSEDQEKFINWKFSAKLVAEGGDVERSMSLNFETACDQKNHCKTATKFRRTPIRELNERYDWTFEAVYDAIKIAEETSLNTIENDKHSEFNAKFTAKWGQKHQQQTVTIKIQGEQSPMHREMLRRLRDQRRGMSSMDRLVLLENFSNLDVFKLFATADIDNETKTLAYNYLTYLRFANWFRTAWTTDKKLDLSTTDMTATITVDNDKRRFVNVSLELPMESLTFYEVELPVSCPLYGFYTTKTKSHKVMSQNKCIVDKERVKSFSGKRFSVPTWASDCYTLLVKDCSNQESSESPRFAVLAKERYSRSQYKKLRILVEDIAMDVELDQSENLVVRIDNELVEDKKRLHSYGIVVREDVFDFENSHIHVQFDGRRIKIRVSALYQNVQCGLCGSYNDDDELEMDLPNKKTTSDIWEFHESYVEKNGQCHVDDSEMLRPANYRHDFTDDEDWLAEKKYLSDLI